MAHISVLLKSNICFKGRIKTHILVCSRDLWLFQDKLGAVYIYMYLLFLLRLQTDQHPACKLHLVAVLYKPRFIHTPHFWQSCWNNFSSIQWKCCTDRKSQNSHGQRTERIWKKKFLLKDYKKVIPAQENQVKMRLLALKNILRLSYEFHFSI